MHDKIEMASSADERTEHAWNAGLFQGMHTKTVPALQSGGLLTSSMDEGSGHRGSRAGRGGCHAGHG